MSTNEPESLRRFAKRYGDALVNTVDEWLPKGGLRRTSPLELSKFATSRTEGQIARLLEQVVDVHARFSDALLDHASRSAPDEVVVLDPSAQLPPTDEISRLLLYTELIVWPDPLIQHPIALRSLVPQDLDAAVKKPLGVYQELLHQCLEFYARYQYAIREGVLLPTAWNVAVTMQEMNHQSFIGDAPFAHPWDAMPRSLVDLAETEFAARATSFDGTTYTVHAGLPTATSSQVALLAAGDPTDQVGAHFETHLEVTGHRQDGPNLIADVAQRPPVDVQSWIAQAKRKLVYNRMITLRSNSLFATRLGGALLTRSQTNHKILKEVAEPAGAQPAGALAIANMRLPAVEGLSVNQIVVARNDEVALANFRSNFRKACAGIKAAAGTAAFRSECEAIARDTVGQGVSELRQSYRALRRKSSLDIFLSTALVGVSCVGVTLGQLQLIPAVLGVANQIKSILDAVPKDAELQRHPYFIVWNSTRKPFSP